MPALPRHASRLALLGAAALLLTPACRTEPFGVDGQRFACSSDEACGPDQLCDPVDGECHPSRCAAGAVQVVGSFADGAPALGELRGLPALLVASCGENPTVHVTGCGGGCERADAGWSATEAIAAGGCAPPVLVSGGGRLAAAWESEHKLEYAECAERCERAGSWQRATLLPGVTGRPALASLDGARFSVAASSTLVTRAMAGECEGACADPAAWTFYDLPLPSGAAVYSGVEAALRRGPSGELVRTALITGAAADGQTRLLAVLECASSCAAAASWSSVTLQQDVADPRLVIPADGLLRVFHRRAQGPGVHLTRCVRSPCASASGAWTSREVIANAQTFAATSSSGGAQLVAEVAGQLRRATESGDGGFLLEALAPCGRTLQGEAPSVLAADGAWRLAYRRGSSVRVFTEQR